MRLEARSASHLLTHLPFNPHCKSCVAGKIQKKKSKHGAFQRKTSYWGELVTADHMDSKSDENRGMFDNREAFTIKDFFSGLIHCYPVPSKCSQDVVSCITHFRGERKISRMYADRAG